MADQEVQTNVIALRNEIQDVFVRSINIIDVKYILHHPSEIDVSAKRSE